ncbi:phosphoribosylanthranilate isomerase [Desulfosarcina cetonica]|uniref:phosphoribosylanthranilate isomerase n=1 Tax=Desulfosarcina cetonica TaxID=90730 RepID=UPI0006D063BE|nr:phosphoribosylanthranilate isomerase [Desulfosarcina cetonica]
MLTHPESPSRPLQVKICGLTRPDEAVACARLGADAIGLVFYPKSPRHVSDDQARAVVAALPSSVAAVGVFVDADFETIMARVSGCGLSMAQLHGRETPALTERLTAAGVGVIKALFVGGRPDLEEGRNYKVDAFLVECAKGPLPGGNAMTWDWAAAREFGRQYPLVLAGGLDPENVATAIQAARPAAIDLSSGVEASPGRKDPDKVARLLEAVNRIAAPDDSFRSSQVFRPRKG